MGMTIFEFEYLTPRQYQNKVKGHIERAQELEVGAMARMRQLAYYFLSTVKMKKKLKSPKDLFSLPIDKVSRKEKAASVPLTTEEAKQLSKRWAKG